jgi:hypothetical protein
MSNRELVMDLVAKLPEDASMEDIMEKIAFVAGGEPRNRPTRQKLIEVLRFWHSARGLPHFKL